MMFEIGKIYSYQQFCDFLQFKDIYFQMGGNNFSSMREENLKRRNSNLQAQMKEVENIAGKIGLTDAKVMVIIRKTACELVQCLNNGQLTSLEIVCAFCKRTGTYGLQLKLITDTMFDKAIEQAKKCDQIRKQTKKRNWTFQDGPYNEEKYLPPLFGVPVSVKEMFDVEGLPSTIGLSSRLQPKEKSSPIISCFLRSGIIPFVKSNVPQLGMAFQSMNEVWGRAENPWNRNRTPGGSTGGQAGLISGYCSPLGLGSDIGGSIRIPAEFCGLFSIKPTSKRLSSTYHTQFLPAFEGSAKGVPLCLGPLARSVHDLSLQLMALYEEEKYGNEADPYVKNVPFNYQEYMKTATGKQKFKIGYFRSLSDIQPSKASARALQESLQLLKKQGHELIQIKVPNEKEMLKAFYFLNLCTQASHYRRLLHGETPALQYKKLFTLSQLWSPLRAIAAFAASKISPRLHYYIASNLGHKKALDVLETIGQINTYRNEWVSYWRENSLDFVVCPGFGCQAVIHTGGKDTTLAAGYTFLWNVLDTPTGTVPVTVVREDEQEYESQFHDEVTDSLKVIARGSAGLPVGIQILALPFQEEKVLGMMKRLQDQIKFSDKYQPHL